MKLFVLCHVHQVPQASIAAINLVLIQDTGGRHNLPGGPIQDGEMPEIAAQRYLRALGVEPSLPDICIVGSLQYAEETILCCQCPCKGVLPALLPNNAEWVTPREISQSDKIPPAMKVVIPLMRAGMKGWLATSHDTLIGVNLEGWQ